MTTTGEVIRLVDEKIARAPGSAQASEYDAFWKATQTLSEARQRLEQPFRRAVERASALETELRRLRGLAQASAARVTELEAELQRQRQLQSELQARATTLEEKATHHATLHRLADGTLNDERERVRELQKAVESLEKQNREQRNALALHRERWEQAVETDRKLRDYIHWLRDETEEALRNAKTEAETTRVRLERELADATQEVTDTRSQFDELRSALRTEQAARELNQQALETYQQQWNSLVTSNQELKKKNQALQEDLSYARDTLARYGPLQDRELLARQNSEQKAEIERLRQQLLARAVVERELAEARAENDRLLQEHLRESRRFHDLAEADHAAKLQLREKLGQAERVADELRRELAHAELPRSFVAPEPAGAVPPPFRFNN